MMSAKSNSFDLKTEYPTTKEIIEMHAEIPNKVISGIIPFSNADLNPSTIPTIGFRM